MIALFVAALVLTSVAEEESGPVFAAGVACFTGGVLVFFRWGSALRDSVFDREDKTAEESPE